ncbi:MAG: RNA methyltransferase [Planctomycetaceae bacterium]|nr:RNA methyltransferase [Planctomycetaceae bacterium]
MSSPRSASGRPKLVGNHNRCWIWGRHVVLETLRAAIWRPAEVLISPRCPSEVLSEIRQCTGQFGIVLTELADSALTRRCRTEEHQGLAAVLPEFPYSDFGQLMLRKPRVERWLVLDGIQDSFNFGAIVRSAVELATDGLVVGVREQSAVNSQVVRSSAGGVNHVPIARVDDLSSGVARLKSTGVRIVAASEKASTRLQDVDLTGPTAIVIGNEGRGVSPEIWALCDDRVRIPTADKVGSLNAAVAAGIFCYERLRQRLSQAGARA